MNKKITEPNVGHNLAHQSNSRQLKNASSYIHKTEHEKGTSQSRESPTIAYNYKTRIRWEYLLKFKCEGERQIPTVEVFVLDGLTLHFSLLSTVTLLLLLNFKITFFFVAGKFYFLSVY